MPDDLRPLIGKREVRRSLRTSDPVEAKRRLTLERLKTQAEFDEARRKSPSAIGGRPAALQNELNDADLWSLVTLWFVRSQKQDAVIGPAEAAAENRLEDFRALTDPDDTNTSGYVVSITRRFLTEQGLAYEVNSEAFRRLYQLMHEALIERDKRLINRFTGTHLGQNPRFDQLTAETALQPGANVTLSDLLDRRERDLSKAPGSPKTKLKRAAQARLFKDVLGAETRVCEIDRERARLLLDAVSRLPANMTKRFKDMPVATVLKLPPEKLGRPMSALTANSYLNAFTGLMEFAVREHLIARNPSAGLRLPSDRLRAKDRRLPFNDEDLKRIFSAPLYSGCENDEHGYAEPGPNRPRRGRFWVPLIALFSGMRLNEICQLDESDVAEIGGYLVFRVQATNDGTKRVKTEAGQRLIPLHPELVRHGLDNLVFRVRQAGPGSRLFPEIAVASTGYASDNFSKWFARFLDHIGIKHARKNFHSFRHNFRDAMRLAGVSDEAARLLGGWANGGTEAAYGGSQEIEAAILYREIVKVRYTSLDLEKLWSTASRHC
nr:site-specific integrase [Methylobacterium segetis]